MSAPSSWLFARVADWFDSNLLPVKDPYTSTCILQVRMLRFISNNWIEDTQQALVIHSFGKWQSFAQIHRENIWYVSHPNKENIHGEHAASHMTITWPYTHHSDGIERVEYSEKENVIDLFICIREHSCTVGSYAVGWPRECQSTML